MTTAQTKAEYYARHIKTAEQPTTTAGSDPTAWLDYAETIRRLRGELEDLQAGAVTVARIHGASWGDVATALAITRQGAQQRYGVSAR